MNKKIIKGIFLSSALTLPLLAVAVSCETKQSAQDKWKKEINRVAQIVVLNYPNKINVSVDKVLTTNVESSNYDKSLYDIKLKSINYDTPNKLVKITFYLMDKKTGTISDDFIKEIDGFGSEENAGININKIANDVVLDYPDKQNVVSSESLIEKVVFSNYDIAKYEVKAVEIRFDNAKKVIWITYTVKDKNSELTSNPVVKQIDGFKAEEAGTEYINDIADKIILDYPDKNNVSLDDVTLSKITSTNYDANKYEIMFVEYYYNLEENLIDVTYIIKNKTSGSTSHKFKKQIKDFSKSKRTDESIDIAVTKVVLDYPNKANIHASLAQASSVQSTNYDTTKYEVKITNIVFDNDNRSVAVSFYLKEKTSEIVSSVITKEIKGFKEFVVLPDDLDFVANSVVLHYPGRENTFPDDVKLDNIVASNYNKTKYKVFFKGTTSHNTRRSVFVTFYIKDLITDSVSKDVTKEITGFKNAYDANLIFEMVANKVMFDYPGKESIIAGRFRVRNLVISNYDKNEYSVIVARYFADSAKKIVTITYYIRDNTTNLSSKEFKKDITGFQ